MKILLSLLLLFGIVCGQVPSFEDFEGANATQWTTGGTLSSWALGTPTKTNINGAKSGTNCWVTGLSTNYNNGEHSFLQSPPFDFTGVNGAIVSFSLKWALEKGTVTAYDGFNFQYSIGNSNWTSLGAIGDDTNWYTDYITSFQNSGWGGQSPNIANTWTVAAHLLPASLNGKTGVNFRFSFSSDGSTNDEGVAVDDFALYPIPTGNPQCAINLLPSPNSVLDVTYTTFTWDRNPVEPDVTVPVGYRVYLDVVNPPVAFVDVGFTTSFHTILPGSSIVYWQVVPYGYGAAIATGCEIRSLTTPAEPLFTIPYFENFEGATNPMGFWEHFGAMDSWAFGTPGLGDNNNKQTISGAYSGSNAWVNGGLTGMYNNLEMSSLLSPAFNFANESRTLIFSAYIWYNTETGYDGAVLQYTLDEGANWVTIGANGDPSSVGWYNAKPSSIGGDAWAGISLTGYTYVAHTIPAAVNGQSPVHFRFLFASDSSSAYDGVAIDDISVDLAPVQIPDCPVFLGPTNQSALSVPFAQFSWQKSPTDNSTFLPTGYLLLLDTVSPPIASIPHIGSSTSYSTIVAPGATYYWTVVPLGFNGVQNTNCGINSFTTPAEPTLTVPYFNDFETDDGFWRPAGSLSTWAFGTPNKFTIVGAASGENAWVTGGLGKTRYNNNEKSFLISPSFDFTDVNQTVLFSASVWWNSQSPSLGFDGANLQYTTDEGVSWNTVGSFGETSNVLNWYTASKIAGLPGNGTDGWAGNSGGYKTVTHALPFSINGHPSVHFRIQFGADATTNTYDGVAIDDIRLSFVTGAPQCSVISPITAAIPQPLSWSNVVGDTAFIFGYRVFLDTSNPPTTLVYSGFGTSYTAFGLLPSTTYYIKVVPVGFQNATNNCAATAFMSAALPVVTVPYFEDFEGGNGGWEATGSLSTWAYGTPNKAVIKGAASGTKAWVNGGLTGMYVDYELSYLISPVVNFSNVASSTYVTFKLWYDTEGPTTPFDGVNLQYATSFTGNWTTLGARNDPNWYTVTNIRPIGQDGWSGHSGGYVTVAHLLPASFNGLPFVWFRVQFASDSSTDYDGVAIDDFAVQLAPTTVPLCALVGTPTIGNPATLNWHRNTSDNFLLPTGYQVYVGTTNPPTTLAYSGTATTFSTPLFPPSTKIYYLVVAVGYNGIVATGCPVYNFTTPSGTMVGFPYYENFENGAGGWVSSGAVNSWQLGTPGKAVITKAASGVFAWATSLNSTYSTNEASTVTSPIIDFRGLSSDPYITINIWWESERGYDGALLQSFTGGAWTTVGNYSATGNSTGSINWYNTASVQSLSTFDANRNGWSGKVSTSTALGHWSLASHVLTGVAGKLAQFRIAFTSDGSNQFDGFAFDDVSIQVLPLFIPIPTTAIPTTAIPTTAIPTTAIPTTARATTAIPTTAVATTAIATTHALPPVVVSGDQINNQQVVNNGNVAVAVGILVPLLAIAAAIVIGLLVYFLVIRKRRLDTQVKMAQLEHELDNVEVRRN